MSVRTNLCEIAQIRRRQHIGEDRDADTPPDKPSDMSKTIDDLVATSKKFVRLLYLSEKTNKNARATIRRLKTAKKRLMKQQRHLFCSSKGSHPEQASNASGNIFNLRLRVIWIVDSTAGHGVIIILAVRIWQRKSRGNDGLLELEILQEAAAVCELLLAFRFFPSMHQAGRILCCGPNKALKCPRTGMCDAEDQRALAVPAPRTEGLRLESRASGFFHGSPPFSPEGGLPVKTQWFSRFSG